MQDNFTNYSPGGVLPQTLDAFRNRPCSLPYTNEYYTPPTTDEVGQLIKLAGWSQNDTARLVGVSFNPEKGSLTVRRWKMPIASDNHRDIPYAAWRLLLLHAGVVKVDDALKELAAFKNLR